jgi:exonuclease III
VILVGDFNSAAEPLDTTETYDLIANAGFVDAWELRNDPAAPGFTCCQANDLRNVTSQLDSRIDLIWLLGQLPAVTPDVHVIGADQADKTSTGLWPSDHAGVVATFAQ